MIVEKAYAKINIGLDIVRKRPDGYHDIDTVMQTIALHDTVFVCSQEKGITVECDIPLVPTGKGNIAYKAASVFCSYSDIDTNENGIRVYIEKRIPMESGLGGGSSDAAAVLRALNTLFCTGYSTDILIKLASKVGSDVPFLIRGGTMRLVGKGEKLIETYDFSGIDVIIVMPDENVSTALAYSLFSKQDNPFHPDMDRLTNLIQHKKAGLLSKVLGNTFESMVFSHKPSVEKALHDILETNPAACSMTGSGAAVYGLYDSIEDSGKAYDCLKDKYEIYMTKTLGGVL